MTHPTPTDPPLPLSVRSVHKQFETPAGSLVILRDVSLEVHPGESLAIVGPSGSGKSTLLNIIGALDLPSSGSVHLGDIDVSSLRGDALADYRARRVGFVFQDHHLLPQCTALENVILSTLPAHRTEHAGDRARELLRYVGLGERIDAMPGVLSGGERQRVAIARALINEPPLLLCDDPTGNLDAEAGARVTRLFTELAREHRICLVMVTHNLELARLLDHVKRLREGVLEDLTP